MGRPRTRFQAECLFCKRLFTRIPAREQSYCTRACYNAARTGKPRGPYVERETRICPVCGDEFIVGGFGNPDRKQKLCSNTCQQKARYRHGRPCIPLSATDAAYIAGLVDGEGSIMLIGRNGEDAHLRISVANTFEPILHWLKETTAIGNIYQHRAEDDIHKASYSWRSHGDGAEGLLAQIRPFLRIKAVQADLALEAQRRLHDPAFKAESSWQSEWRARMKELNRRGPVVQSTFDSTWAAGG